MIDLHIHSTLSDGSDNLVEIVKKANDLGLEVISITDHNNCFAHLKNNKTILEAFNGEVITGTEISTYFDGQVIHVLAYNFDALQLNKFLRKLFLDYGALTKDECQVLMSTLKKLNIQHPVLKSSFDYSKIWSARYFAKFILTDENKEKYFSGKNLTINQLFWEHLTNKESPLFCDFKDLRPHLDEVIKKVHEAGGKCFIAHSNLYGKHFTQKFDTIKNAGIDGFECYYPTYSQEFVNMVVKYCEDNNLLKSAGSDYHGSHRENKLGTGLAGNLCKSVKVIEDWYKKN
jgi:predicted metal-dependent phosphoesterase TrpH